MKSHRYNDCLVTGKALLENDFLSTLAFIQNLNHISQYEPKLKTARPEASNDKQGYYYAEGKFIGISWSGKFSYQLTTKGFHSEMIEGPLKHHMSGGFVITEEDIHHATITHYEKYALPMATRWLNCIIKPYLFFAMKKELRNIAKNLNCRLTRLYVTLHAKNKSLAQNL